MRIRDMKMMTKKRDISIRQPKQSRGIFGIAVILLILSTYCFGYLKDVFLLQDTMTPAQNESFKKESHMSEYSSPQGIGNHPLLRKTTILKEFNLGTESYDNPFVVGITLTNNWIVLGQQIVADISTNEELRQWEIMYQNTTPNSTWYNNRHLYVELQPATVHEGTMQLDLVLVDLGGNIGEGVATFDITVDSGLEKITANSIFNEIVNEVHVGRQGAEGIVFDLTATEKAHYIEGFTISIDVNTLTNPFEKIYFYSEDSNQLLAEVSTPSYKFNLSVSTGNLVGFNPQRFVMKYDLLDNVPTSVNYTFQLLNIRSKKITGDQRVYITTPNLNSYQIGIVPKAKPIVVKSEVNQFIGQSNLIEPEIEHEVLEGSVVELRYRVHNISLGSYSGWTTMRYQSSTITGDNRFRMLNNQISNLALNHNQIYSLEYELIGNKQSKIVSTNQFLVDLTVPDKPEQIYIDSEYLSELSGAEAAVYVPIEIRVDIPQSLDVESGVQAYSIMKKSGKNPEWKVTTAGVITTENSKTLQLQEEVNDLYYYKVAVQNKASNWSEYSDEKEIDLRLNAALINSIFNHPNPFDNRIEVTTIYYTLSEQADVNLYIYDMFGYIVKKWNFLAGYTGGKKENSIEWDGTNMLGHKVSKGGYILIIKAKAADGETMVKKTRIGVIH